MGDLKRGQDKLARFWSRENIVTSRQSPYSDYMATRMFDKELNNVSGKKVLDIGCGHGRMMDYFVLRKAKPIGIDISPDSVKRVQEKKHQGIIGDARNLPVADSEFDIVFSLGVVEHFKETEQAIKEHLRACRPGGTIIVMVPHLISPYILAYLWHFLRGSARYGIAAVGKKYSREVLKQMLIRAGCCKVRVTSCYGSALLRVLPLAFYKRLARFLDGLLLGRYFGHWLWGIGYKE